MPVPVLMERNPPIKGTKVIDMLTKLNKVIGTLSGGVPCLPSPVDTAKAKILRNKEKKKKRRKRKRAANASNMNSTMVKTEPDPDSIKMFVGQIPRSMDETDLRKMFEEYGPVHQLNVLRDKISGQSKGCCFVTFYTRKAALDAQNALHNIKTMPGMQHPVQMKPADSEKRNEERKLFVGMLSKKCSENEVRMMFAPFGQIEECTVLREQNGQSKGCAFVTYASKQCAQNAVKTLHQGQTMEGCRAPLVVKFADTQKEKEMKKLQQLNANLLQNIAGLGGLNNLTPQYLALLQQISGSSSGSSSTSNMGGALGNLGNLGLGLNALQLQQILSAAATAAAALQNNPVNTAGLAAVLATLNTTLNNTSTSSTSSTTTQSNNNSTSNSPASQQSHNTGDLSSLQNLQNLQGLAALAALASNQAGGNSSNSTGNLSTQNLAALQQLASLNSNSGSPSLLGMSSAGGSLSTNTSNSSALMGGFGSATQNSVGPPGMSSGVSTNGINGIGNCATSAGSGAGSMETLSQAYSGIQQYAGLSGLLGQASFPGAFAAQSTAQLQQAAANSPAGKQTEGPEGGNLFIYHLPQEFSDHDLLQMFLPFGTVVSAKVFIDKQTNLSKCFGFVSYDNPMSASAAIQAMNGFQIGTKRLKVQLKRPKSDSKPY